MIDPTARPIPTQLPLMLLQFPEAAQWVRLGAGLKTPIAGVPWRRVRPTYPELQNHVGEGGNGGVVPASATWREGIRLAVLDVDRGDAGALTAAYPPVALAETRRGSHAWYLHPDPPAVNATWSGPGGTGGDYRGMNGYAALHGDELAIVDRGSRVSADGGATFPSSSSTSKGIARTNAPSAVRWRTSCPRSCGSRPRCRGPLRTRSRGRWSEPAIRRWCGPCRGGAGGASGTADRSMMTG